MPHLCLLFLFLYRKTCDRKHEKTIPNVNWNAGCWNELIDLTSTGVAEPPSIKNMSSEEIQNCLTNLVRPTLPDFPSHSQSVERSVKLVSSASQQVYGFESRHASILTKVSSRKMRPSFTSKSYYSQSYDDIL